MKKIFSAALIEKIPLWIKILIVFFGLFLVASVLGAISKEFLGPLFLILLILFPGKNKSNPRLVAWAPWIWMLSFATAVIVLIFAMMGKNLLPPEANPPSTEELFFTAVTSPVFIYLYFSQKKLWLKRGILLSAVLGIVVGLLPLIRGEVGVEEFHWIETLGNISSDFIFAVYFWLKY
jgi:hypothetical protein